VVEERAAFQPTLTPTFQAGVNRDENDEDDENVIDALGPFQFYQLELRQRFITGTTLSMRYREDVTEGASDLEPTLRGSLYDAQARIALVQPLLRDAWPAVVGSDLITAKRAVEAQKNTVESNRQRLILDVVSLFYRIKSLEQILEIAQKGLERTERLLKATEAKLKMELATALDLARAQVQDSSQKQAVSRAQQDLDNALDDLRLLLALPLDQQLRLDQAGAAAPDEAYTEAMAPELEAVAVARRPDYRNAEIAIEEAERIASVRWRDRLPRTDLFVTYDRAHPDAVTTALGEPLEEWDWTAGVRLSYPIPWTGASANYHQARIDAGIRRRALHELRANIQQTIRTDLRNVVATQERLAHLRIEIENADRRLKIATFRFERGLADNFEVVSAETALQNANFNYQRGVAELLIARDRLKLDMGVLRYED
jgi:outer membrane protein TolC